MHAPFFGVHTVPDSSSETEMRNFSASAFLFCFENSKKFDALQISFEIDGQNIYYLCIDLPSYLPTYIHYTYLSLQVGAQAG